MISIKRSNSADLAPGNNPFPYLIAAPASRPPTATSNKDYSPVSGSPIRGIKYAKLLSYVYPDKPASPSGTSVYFTVP